MNEPVKLNRKLKVLLLTILKRGTLLHTDARELMSFFEDTLTDQEIKEMKKRFDEEL